MDSHKIARNAMAMAIREVHRKGARVTRAASASGVGTFQVATQMTSRLPLPMSPGLLLYVAVPLVLLALPLALFRVAVGPQTSLVLSLYFWSATVMVGWLSGALGSAVLFRLCARFRPPLWIITLAGPILSGLVLRGPILEILSLTNSLHVGAQLKGSPGPLMLDWVSWEKFVINLAPGTITWVVANYVFDRLLGVPCYRYQCEHAGRVDRPADLSVGINAPPLIERLPLSVRGDLVALKSDDHYVRVYTTIGETLTLARLRDAIEMAQPIAGMQVHRSVWVADRAVKGFRRNGHSGTVYLSNGLEVPVSRSYCQQAERRFKNFQPHRCESAQKV